MTTEEREYWDRMIKAQEDAKKAQDKNREKARNKYNQHRITSIKGGDRMQDIKIINYITMDGKTRRWEELSEEEKKRASEKIQENFMRVAGYRRTV